MTKTVKLALIAGALTIAACDQKAASPSAGPGDAGGVTADAPGRLRGTLSSITANGIDVATYAGPSRQVTLGDKTGYAWVVASSLGTLKNGDFIGTATTGPDSDLKATEIVIFPETMRGTGEGHYGWDTPGIVQAAGQSAAGTSAMTNGTVTQSAMTNGTVQQSGMTNGTVATASGGPTPMLTITYTGGSAKVRVPAGTPVVRFEPTDKASLAKGQKLFIKLGDDHKVAQFVAIGKNGVTPPM